MERSQNRYSVFVIPLFRSACGRRRSAYLEYSTTNEWVHRRALRSGPHVAIQRLARTLIGLSAAPPPTTNAYPRGNRQGHEEVARLKVGLTDIRLECNPKGGPRKPVPANPVE